MEEQSPIEKAKALLEARGYVIEEDAGMWPTDAYDIVAAMWAEHEEAREVIKLCYRQMDYPQSFNGVINAACEAFLSKSQ
jgi:hypothetical protein